MDIVDVGQIWKNNTVTNINNLQPNSYFVVLSKDKEYWKIGNFWILGSKKEWGGARQMYLDETEILDNACYVLNIQELV